MPRLIFGHCAFFLYVIKNCNLYKLSNIISTILICTEALNIRQQIILAIFIIIKLMHEILFHMSNKGSLPEPENEKI